MTLEQLIKALTPEAIMHYEVTHNVPEELRVGYMESQCKSSKDDDTQTLTLQ